MPDRVLITRRLPPPAAELLREAGFTVDVLDTDDPPPRDLLLRHAAGVAGILSTFTERIDPELLAAAGSTLRIVANFAVGYDNIDLAACRAAGVRATNTPDVLTDAVADLTWALLLATARRIGAGERLVRAGRWQGWTPTQLLGLELRGSTLGIVGAGRIGTAVALRAAPFGMRVVYAQPRANPTLDTELRATRLSLDDLLRSADVISLHVPLRAENRHLIGQRELALLKPTAMLINTSRGPVIDERALIDALRSGQLAAAGLDVYEHEPRVSPELLEMENVVLLPHLGSSTEATRARMSRMAADNIIAVLRGREPLNPIS